MRRKSNLIVVWGEISLIIQYLKLASCNKSESGYLVHLVVIAREGTAFVRVYANKDSPSMEINKPRNIRIATWCRKSNCYNYWAIVGDKTVVNKIMNRLFSNFIHVLTHVSFIYVLILFYLDCNFWFRFINFQINFEYRRYFL